jgi:membrane protein implicated in regulation of membrane protease activity
MELAVVLAVLAVLAVIGMILGRRMRASSGTVGTAPQPGAPGVVQAPLTPTGTVLLGGETWSARTADHRTLDRGTRVRLQSFDGLIAVVEPLTHPDAPQPDASPASTTPPASPPGDRA